MEDENISSEEQGYRLEKGRQRAIAEQKRKKDIVWAIALLLVAVFLWFTFLSPRARREAQQKREFKEKIDAIVDGAIGH